MRLETTFSEHRKRIEAELHESHKCIEADLGSVHVVTKSDFESYEGPYEIIPKSEDQILPTDEKVMREDLKVKATPYHEVENIQGGMTAIIGG